MAAPDYERFKDLTFDGFRKLAVAEGLSRYERIGFPDAYRAGHEEAIVRDIFGKLPTLASTGKTILDIGAGCSEVPMLLSAACQLQGHTIYYCDSAEMLTHILDEPHIRKLIGRFPCDVREFIGAHVGRIDAILAYSVIQYVFAESSIFDFVDACLELLAPNGELLIGDIPNVSKRKRFFGSQSGVQFHQRYTATSESPEVVHNVIERSRIDDSVVLAILARARAAGFDSFVVPLAPDLPMANRREDILIRRP